MDSLAVAEFVALLVGAFGVGFSAGYVIAVFRRAAWSVV